MKVSLLISAFAVIVLRAVAAETGTTLAYHSDYLSFVGRDEKGLIAFALDNNRGRDGDAYQAEHFVVLHEEHLGWLPLEGNGDYPNHRQQLEEIPDSESFRFTLTAEGGIVVVSRINNLEMTTGALTQRFISREGNRIMGLASGDAVLTWHGRTLKGRVIHETVRYENWNRLTRTYFDTWNNFQGLYLVSWPDDEPERLSDLYVESTGSGDEQKVLGFLSPDFNDVVQATWRLSVEDKAWGLGFYRWPVGWTVTAMNSADGRAGEAPILHATLREHEGNTIATWILGGFRMGIVTGDAVIDGRRYRVYGLSELIM